MPSLELQQAADTRLFESMPLQTMNELGSWEPSNASRANIATIPLHQRSNLDPAEPRLIVTHDMAGGYKEDSNIQGNTYDTIYSCQYWQYVDTFIYFSHHRVTIPPVNWINACHRNGVKTLGTFIVEGAAGMFALERFVYGPEPGQRNSWSPYYADKLGTMVDIAEFYGFDGWLLNIESDFFPLYRNPSLKAIHLAKLLRYLKNAMHARVPGSEIIWYDSMTTNGSVQWQNNITPKNSIFFEAADGIFLNYWWNATVPPLALQVAHRLGRQGSDVYFGTDVWGRGTFGGGGFDSYLAVGTARAFKTSSALFGTAWIYEHFGKKDFELMDRLLWLGGDQSEYPAQEGEQNRTVKVTSHLGRHPGIADVSPVRSAPGKTWFATWFDRGYGTGFYYQGKKLLSQPWSHLSHQSIPPNLIARLQREENHGLSYFLADDDAYIGGTSLLIAAEITQERQLPLYQLEYDVTEGCEVQFIYKSPEPDMQGKIDIYLNLQVTDILPDELAFYWQDVTDASSQADATTAMRLYLNENTVIYLKPSRKQELAEGWLLCSVRVPPTYPLGIATIKELGIHVDGTETVLFRLGLLTIIPLGDAPSALSRITQVQLQRDEDIHSKCPSSSCELWATLSWMMEHNSKEDWDQVDHYMIFFKNVDSKAEPIFLGTSFSTEYRISGLEIKKHGNSIEIWAVNRLGTVIARQDIDIQ